MFWERLHHRGPPGQRGLFYDPYSFWKAYMYILVSIYNENMWEKIEFKHLLLHFQKNWADASWWRRSGGGRGHWGYLVKLFKTWTPDSVWMIEGRDIIWSFTRGGPEQLTRTQSVDFTLEGFWPCDNSKVTGFWHDVMDYFSFSKVVWAWTNEREINQVSISRIWQIPVSTCCRTKRQNVILGGLWVWWIFCAQRFN